MLVYDLDFYRWCWNMTRVDRTIYWWVMASRINTRWLLLRRFLVLLLFTRWIISSWPFLANLLLILWFLQWTKLWIFTLIWWLLFLIFILLLDNALDQLKSGTNHCAHRSFNSYFIAKRWWIFAIKLHLVRATNLLAQRDIRLTRNSHIPLLHFHFLYTFFGCIGEAIFNTLVQAAFNLLTIFLAEQLCCPIIQFDLHSKLFS